MNQRRRLESLTVIIISILMLFTADASSKDHLKLCFSKQVKPLGTSYVSFSYSENSNELGHDFEPWKQTNYISNGTAWCGAEDFLKSDTLTNRKVPYYSKTQYSRNALLVQDYGNDVISPVTENTFSDFIIETARYSPVLLINYFSRQNLSPDTESNTLLAVYKLIMNKKIIRLYIDTKTGLLEKITAVRNDDMLGDVTDTYLYKNYARVNGLFYPAAIDIDKYGGKIHDEIIISSCSLVSAAPVLLTKPDDYTIKEETEIIPDITTEKYNDNIYFVTLKHTESKSAIVIFKDFILVAEAPLSSANGELIIAEAKKIAPGKPIKYFAFGHHHPWYLGGVRPFVHIGATILTVKDDIPYLEYLASAKHTLQPDSLQLQPMPLVTEEVGLNKTITDGDYKMEIYFIGDKSAHTKDYLLFYFPAEKLLLEGDLAWISQTGEVKKAGKRQAGLYNAIKELELDVEAIIQNWPVGDKYGVKSVIPFSELEQSMSVK